MDVWYKVVELKLNVDYRESLLNQDLKGGWRMVSAYPVVLSPPDGGESIVKHFVVLEFVESS